MTNVHTCVISNNAFARLALYSILKPVTSRLYFFTQPDRTFCRHALKAPPVKNVILALFDAQGRESTDTRYIDVLSTVLPGAHITVLTDLLFTSSCWRNGHLMLSRKARVPAITSALHRRLSPTHGVSAFCAGSGSRDTLLTDREIEVLELWYCGFSMTRIATLLGRSVKTVSGRKRSAMLKLSVRCDQALYSVLAASGRALTRGIQAGRLQ